MICTPPNIITDGTGWAGHEGMRENKNAYWLLAGKSDGQRPHRKFTGILTDNIKIYLQAIGWNVLDFINVSQNTDT